MLAQDPPDTPEGLLRRCCCTSRTLDSCLPPGDDDGRLAESFAQTNRVQAKVQLAAVDPREAKELPK